VVAPSIRPVQALGQLATTAPTRRLAKPDRRQQLLDIAADLVTSSGTAAITMERVAEHAGVSKALPYQHFTNAEDLLLALHTRELTHLGTRIVQAVTAAPSDPETKLRAAIGVYFDVVAQRGVLLGILGRETTTAATASSVDGTGFVADLLTETHGITGERARILAEMVLGSLLGAVTAWARGVASRSMVQATATEGVLAMVDGLPEVS